MSASSVNQSMINKPPALLIELTVEQLALVEPFMDCAREHADAGKPGMAVAQIAGTQMKVGFLPHKKSAALAARDEHGNRKTLRTFEDEA